MMASDLLQAALSYARRGWPVLPLHSISPTGRCSCRAERCKRPAKHPLVKWGEGGSTDERTIKEWWLKWPNANIAVITGKPSELVVLDVDPRHGGEESMRELAAKHGRLSKTIAVRTGSGGWHFYFQRPGTNVPNKTDLLPGVDLRGDGGYVIAPPSRHASGCLYRWLRHGSLAPMPAWLCQLINPPEQERPRAFPAREDGGGDIVYRAMAYIDKIPGAIEGQGGDLHTYKVACLLVRDFGLSEEEAFHALGVWNQKCMPLWNEADLRQKIRNALKSARGSLGSLRDTPLTRRGGVREKRR